MTEPCKDKCPKCGAIEAANAKLLDKTVKMCQKAIAEAGKEI